LSNQDFGCNTGDVIYLGVNYGADNDELNNFIEAHNIQFPCASGLEGSGNVVNEQYEIQSYITCIVVMPDREIVGQFYGPYYPERDTLNKLLLTLGAEMKDCTLGLSENHQIDDVKVFPNPLTQQSVLYVNINKQGDYNIKILNDIGQIIHDNSYTLLAGDNKIRINFSLLKDGMYVMQIEDKDRNIIRKKLIIQ